MKIVFDYREKDIISICESIVEKEQLSKDITLHTERLDIGDIIIKDDDDKEMLIIERKSIADLMSSVKDGRYKEQSLRLNSSDTHNHNIIYLIEGITSGYGYIENPRINMNTVYSCMCSLMLYKGFSIIKSSNKVESSNIILKFADKINKDKTSFYYNLSTLSSNSNMKLDNEIYSSTIKKVKSENINIENIGEIMLIQIPKISANIAHEIMVKHKSINTLLEHYRENNNILEEFTYKNNKDQLKKLTKPAIENIKLFLLNN